MDDVAGIARRDLKLSIAHSYDVPDILGRVAELAAGNTGAQAIIGD
jgi:hypothetical protein